MREKEGKPFREEPLPLFRRGPQRRIIEGVTGGGEIIRGTPGESIYITGCEDAVFEVQSACIKLTIENCERCVVKVTARIITSMIELIRLKDCGIEVAQEVQTVSLDMCERVGFVTADIMHFHRLVLALCDQVFIQNKAGEKVRLAVDRGDFAEAWQYENVQYIADRGADGRFPVRPAESEGGYIQ